MILHKELISEIIEKSNYFTNENETIVKNIYLDDSEPQVYYLENKITGEKFILRVIYKDKQDALLRANGALSFISSNANIKHLLILEKRIEHKSTDYVLMNFIDGDSINKINKRINDTAVQSLISEIKKLHSIKGTVATDFLNDSFNSVYEMFSTKFKKHLEGVINLNLFDEKKLLSIYDNMHKTEYLFKDIVPQCIHFDIKESNIVYNQAENNLKLIDYELCRLFDYRADLSRYCILQEVRKKKNKHDYICDMVIESVLNMSREDFEKSEIHYWHDIYFHAATIRNGADRYNFSINHFEKLINMYS